MRRILVVLLVALVACACGHSRGSGASDYDPCSIEDNAYAPTKVKWWIDDEGVLRFQNHAKVSSWESGDDSWVAVTWYCASYPDEGVDESFVRAEFLDKAGDGHGWIEYFTFIDDGACEDECL